MKKEQLTQLADFLLNDALQQQDEVALYHALERLEKGAKAIHDLTCAANELATYRNYIPSPTHKD